MKLLKFIWAGIKGFLNLWTCVGVVITGASFGAIPAALIFGYSHGLMSDAEAAVTLAILLPGSLCAAGMTLVEIASRYKKFGVKGDS